MSSRESNTTNSKFVHEWCDYIMSGHRHKRKSQLSKRELFNIYRWGNPFTKANGEQVYRMGSPV